MYYFDASALAKRYVREPGSARVRRWLSSGTGATSRYSAVEVASALARRAREGRVSHLAAARQQAALDTDLRAMHIVELTPAVAAVARALVQRHALRAGDAVQLASCIEISRALGEAMALVAFGDRLNTAARLEGVTIAGGPIW